jgi:hypothetical protein
MILTTLKWVALTVLSVLFIALLGAFAGVSWQTLGGPRASSSQAGRALPAVPVLEPQLVKPLTAAEALAANDALPFASNGLERASSFGTGDSLTDPLAYKAALDCLTAAVYYEAAGEGDQGQRAVAQVVLNRVRHPRFPGASLRRGLSGLRATDRLPVYVHVRRQPDKAAEPRGLGSRSQDCRGCAGGFGWTTAVGMATHYHANWVVPYWAPRLDKIAAVGNHIFYRWSGLWGRRQAFTPALRWRDDNAAPDLTDTEMGLNQAGENPLDLNSAQSRQSGAADALSPTDLAAEGRSGRGGEWSSTRRPAGSSPTNP